MRVTTEGKEIKLEFDGKPDFSNFVQSLASAYYDHMVGHGYKAPPYDGSEDPLHDPCCTLPMMWESLEQIAVVKLLDDGKDFEMDTYDGA